MDQASDEKYRWYPLDAPRSMAGEFPRPGLYQAKLVKGGVYVAVAIFVPCPIDPATCEPMDRSRQLVALVNGKWWFRPIDIWTSCLKGGAITAGRYRYLVDDRAWAAQHAAHLPEADPFRAAGAQKASTDKDAKRHEKAADLTKIAPVF